MKDYYEVLGVSKTATQDEIKAAYRTLAKQWHPDRHPGTEKKVAEEKFKEIGEAYENIGDPNKRSTYDHRGEDSFANFFHNFHVHHHHQQQDTVGTIEIDLVEAANGGTRKVTIEHEVPCEACDGTGSSTKKKRTCPRCNGAGQITINHGNGLFVFHQSILCPSCSGSREIPESSCSACSGKTEQTKIDTLELIIPAGVDNRHVLKAAKMGRHGGDLKIVIVVRRHPKFERLGNDLYCSLDIPFKTALLGGKVHTTGLNGEQVEFDIPRGCQYGGEIVVNEKGICGGNLRVKVNFQIPCLPDDIAYLMSTLLPA